jgi:hypothetical protein
MAVLGGHGRHLCEAVRTELRAPPENRARARTRARAAQGAVGTLLLSACAASFGRKKSEMYCKPHTAVLLGDAQQSEPKTSPKAGATSFHNSLIRLHSHSSIGLHNPTHATAPAQPAMDADELFGDLLGKPKAAGKPSEPTPSGSAVNGSNTAPVAGGAGGAGSVAGALREADADVAAQVRAAVAASLEPTLR